MSCTPTATCSPTQATGHWWEFQDKPGWIACKCGAELLRHEKKAMLTLSEAYAHKLAGMGYGVTPKPQPAHIYSTNSTSPATSHITPMGLEAWLPDGFIAYPIGEEVRAGGEVTCRCVSLLSGHDNTCAWGKK